MVWQHLPLRWAGVQDISGVLAVFAERRQNRNAPMSYYAASR